MRRLFQTRSVRALGAGLVLGVALPVLAAGCGAEGDASANASAKAEAPAGNAPAPSAKPAKKNPKDLNDLSPRERRELGKSGQ